MLLKPDIKEYNSIIKDLIHNTNSGYDNPEQDYLSFRYAKNWTNISFLYNFQFGLTDRAKKYNAEDVYNLHFSSRLKPWRILSKPEETWRWINEDPINVPYYRLWIENYETIRDKLFITL